MLIKELLISIYRMPRNRASDDAPKYRLKIPEHLSPYKTLQSLRAMHERLNERLTRKREQEKLQQEEDEIVSMASAKKFPAWVRKNKGKIQ
jgi:hypothetical protein